MRLLYMYHAQDPPHGSVRPGTLPDPARAFRPYRPMVLMQRAQLPMPSPTHFSSARSPCPQHRHRHRLWQLSLGRPLTTPNDRSQFAFINFWL